MPSTFAARAWSVERAVFALVGAVLVFLASLIEFGILAAAFFYAWASVIGVGLYLLFVRFAFLRSIPAIIYLAGPIIGVANAFIAAFVSLEDVVITIVTTIDDAKDLFENVANALASVFTGSKDHQVDYAKYNFVRATFLHKDQLTRPLKDIATACRDVDSVASIAAQWMPPLVDAVMCPVFRSLWPLPYSIGPSLYGPWSGWVSDPTPFNNPPMPMGNNCQSTHDRDPYGVFCACLAAGFPVLEVILPCVFIGILLLSSGSEIGAVIAWALRAAVRAAMLAAGLVVSLVNETEKWAKMVCARADRML